MEALVAQLEGRLVGLAHMVFHCDTSVAEPVCFLQDLIVEATLHGKGIGRALIEAVFTRANSAGMRRVYWHVLETNVTAMRLYDKVASRSRLPVTIAAVAARSSRQEVSPMRFNRTHLTIVAPHVCSPQYNNAK